MVGKQRYFEYCYTKLGRWTVNLSNDPHTLSEYRWLAYHYTRLGRLTSFGWWTLHSTRAEMTCIPPHKTCRWTYLAFLKKFLLRKWLTFIPRAPETSTSKFLGVLNTMAKVWKLQHSLFLRYPTAFLKTHFCLESVFLSFLQLQKPLLVSFWGCWTQWQRFESSSIHCFWDSPQHFLKTHLCLESGFLLFLELQKSLLVTSHAVLNTMVGKGLKAPAFTVFEILPHHFLNTFWLRQMAYFHSNEPPETSTSRDDLHGTDTQLGKGLKPSICFNEIPHSISQNTFLLRDGLLSFTRAPETWQLVNLLWGCWTQWQRFESSSIHCFWDTPQFFLKTHFCLEKWLSFVPRAPEIPTSKFSAVLNTMVGNWKQRYFEYRIF